MTDMRLTRDGATEVPGPLGEGFPVHHAQDLTRGGTQARIVLGDQVYSLRITRAGKLILTK
ncbi:hemin uptake protein HemP [Thalassobius vesicularis]|uniref:Hemin uptake protein HemP n=1 Tax=Thalassobius vesicularis TaxID=1294297 RepID=A0A4S3M7U0_9RHOB|nr:hemin uptake protein HemP [Thalassobius vesicularis]